MYLISACLTGINCKYDGHNNYHEVAKKLLDHNLAITACPEELGGLPTPRIPSEIVNNKIMSKDQKEVTKEFKLGATKTLELVKKHNIKIAILQKRSPSCGVHKIYDGSFSGTLIDGQGVTTELLRTNGIKVITIDDYIRDYYKSDFEVK